MILGRYGTEIAYQHHAQILDAVRAGDAQTAAEAMRMQRVEEALLDLTIECPTCRLMDQLKDDDHGIERCVELKNLLKRSYRDVRRQFQVRYSAFSCCFVCSLPCD